MTLDVEKTMKHTVEAMNKNKSLFNQADLDQLAVAEEKAKLYLEAEKEQPVVTLLTNNLKVEKKALLNDIFAVASGVYYFIKAKKLSKEVYFESDLPGTVKQSIEKGKVFIKRCVSIIQSGKDNGISELKDIIVNISNKIDTFIETYKSETDTNSDTMENINELYADWLTEFNVLKYMIKIVTIRKKVKYSDFVNETKVKKTKGKKEEPKNTAEKPENNQPV